MQHFMPSLAVPLLFIYKIQRPHWKAKIQNKFANYWEKKVKWFTEMSLFPSFKTASSTNYIIWQETANLVIKKNLNQKE